ncbi:hypothetical protein [Mesorhizobium sp. M1406]|uniref:hypothetical protein n=1 Tax=Mesorhizobium sp. M1406 TaxID=2957099 RepID=UPI00333C1F39
MKLSAGRLERQRAGIANPGLCKSGPVGLDVQTTQVGQAGGSSTAYVQSRKSPGKWIGYGIVQRNTKNLPI